jgi:serine/threonine-protein kinase
MDRIVLTAMAKDVATRYQSAQDLRADLQRFERGRPILAGPADMPEATTAMAVHVPAPAPAARAVASEPAPVRRKGAAGPIIAVGLALVLLIGFIVFLLANSDFGNEAPSTPTADVPSVVGRNFAQAEAALREQGFEVARTDVDAPSQLPNVVLAQDPEAGRKFPTGDPIALTVSSATITMPNVVGQARTEAASTLAATNLRPTFVEEDNDQPPGTVLRTDPGADGAVAKLPLGGRPTVTVVVAREPAVPVPDVTTQDPFGALTTLNAAGFQVTVQDVPSDTVPQGMVIGTDPAAGTPLPRGSAVRLLVSSGPSLVPVPSMVGQPRATAEAVLFGQLGFGLEISFANAGADKQGQVVAQEPGGGEAPRGSTIALVVGL